MKVKDLKEILEEKLEILDQYEDDADIKMVSNTYFLGGAPLFLGIAGSNGGYINLSYLEESISYPEEEEDEDE